MKKLKTNVIILNAVIALLCVLAVAGYFFLPFISLKMTVTVTDGEQLAAQFKQSDDSLDSLDYNEILNGVTVDVGIQMSTLDVFSSLFSLTDVLGGTAELPQSVTNMIDENVDLITEAVAGQFSTIVADIAPQIMTSVVNDRLYTVLNDELKPSMPDATEEETREELEKVGINDDYIAQKTSEVLETMYADDATLENVSDHIVSVVEDIYSKLQQSENEQLSTATFTPEMEKELRDDIEKYAKDYGLVDENGNIDMNDFGVDLLLSLLKNESSPETAPLSVSVLSATVLTNVAIPTDQTTQTNSSIDELKSEISSLVYSYVEPGSPYLQGFMIGLSVVAALILLSMIPWIYLLIKVIVKCFSRNPGAKLKAPIIFGWIPFLFFMAIPDIALLFLPSILALFNAPALPVAIQATILSSSLIAFAAAVALIVIFIFYRSLRKKLKVETVVQSELESFNNQ